MNGIYMLVNGIAQYLNNRQINQHGIAQYLRTIRIHNTVTQNMLPQFWFFFYKNSIVSNEVIAA